MKMELELFKILTWQERYLLKAYKLVNNHVEWST